MKKIVWFTTYPPNVDKLKRIFIEKKLSIDVQYCTMEHMYEDIMECVDQGVQVVIVRGGVASATEFRRRVPVPVVNVQQTSMDFFTLTDRIRSNGQKTALVGWYSNVMGISRFVESLGDVLTLVNLEPYGFDNCTLSIAHILTGLKQQGVKCIVGGGSVVTVAQKMGFDTLYVGLLDTATILRAAEEADYQLSLLNTQQNRYEVINSIFNCVTEGIIAIDTHFRLTNMNDMMKSLLGISSDEWKKRQLDEYVIINGIEDTMLKGEKITNSIVSVNGTRMVANTMPILIDTKVAGVVITMQKLTSVQKIERRIRADAIDRGLYAKKNFDNIKGTHPSLEATKKRAKVYAHTDSTVLITGESGVGKELFAQSIHNESVRRTGPFVAINCATLPESLLESELFGYVKGAFTGARIDGKAGVFEMADAGTLFLDEISEVTPAVQARLLRALQEREITRIGDDKVIRVDVRVLAASNKNLEEEMRKGNFRKDLYYRLCVLPLHVPALRERRSDILEVAKYIYDSSYSRTLLFTDGAKKIMTEYDWPGNVRELSNFVERIYLLCSKSIIDEDDVKMAIGMSYDMTDSTQAVDRYISDISMDKDTEHILKVLHDNNGNKMKTAAQLGISTTTLWRRLKEIESKNS